MFTGIVEEVGKINSVVKSSSSIKISIKCQKVLENSKLGDSIAVNGVCLTITDIKDNCFFADVSYETINKSSLKNIISNEPVNLEKALTLSTPLGGHLVQGHVDNTGVIASIIKKDESYTLKVNYPNSIDKFIVEKGSISIDGISLTIAKVLNNSFEVAVIPHTFHNTTLSNKKNGDLVNLEVDMIARYAEKLLKNSTKEYRMKKLISDF